MFFDVSQGSQRKNPHRPDTRTSTGGYIYLITLISIKNKMTMHNRHNTTKQPINAKLHPEYGLSDFNFILAELYRLRFSFHSTKE